MMENLTIIIQNWQKRYRTIKKIDGVNRKYFFWVFILHCNNGGISIQTFRWVSNFYCNGCKLNIKLTYFIFIQSRNLTQLGDKKKLTENWPDREKQIARQCYRKRFWVTDEKISIENSLYSVIHLGMFQLRNVPERWKHTIFSVSRKCTWYSIHDISSSIDEETNNYLTKIWKMKPNWREN